MTKHADFRSEFYPTSEHVFLMTTSSDPRGRATGGGGGCCFNENLIAKVLIKITFQKNYSFAKSIRKLNLSQPYSIDAICLHTSLVDEVYHLGFTRETESI